MRNVTVRFGISVSTKKDVTPLMRAASEDHIRMIEFLLANGADEDARTHEGSTALMSAVVNGRAEVVELLLESGADVSARG